MTIPLTAAIAVCSAHLGDEPALVGMLCDEYAQGAPLGERAMVHAMAGLAGTLAALLADREGVDAEQVLHRLAVVAALADITE